MGRDSGTLLAVVVDPGRLAAGIVDLTGEVLVRDRISAPEREIWRSLDRLVRRVLAARPDDVAAPVRVGVSCAGPIDVVAGAVSPAGMPAWLGFPLRQHLEDLTELPVVIDTPGAAAVDAELWLGNTPADASFFNLSLGSEIESACVIGGVRLHGAHGNAGALAHVTVDPGGPLCTCGARGCLRARASASALVAEMNRPLRRATDSIIERTGIMVGRAVASAAAVFDVTSFHLSGVVVDTFGDQMLAALRREVASRSRLDHLADLEVIELVSTIEPLPAAAALALRASV